MRPQYHIVTQPITEPISITQASAHLRVDSEDDADYITGLIPVAREYVDSVTGKVSSPATFRLSSSSWRDLFAPSHHHHLSATATQNGIIQVFRTPLVSVTNVRYYEPDAASLTTMSADDYRVITTTQPGLIQIHGDLPPVHARPDAIQIEFIAGAWESTTEVHRHAIKMLIAHLYENRMPVAFASCHDIPFTLRNMIENQKIGGYF